MFLKVKKIILFLLIFVSVQKVCADNKEQVVIKGDAKSLDLSDVPNSKYDFDDTIFANTDLQPEKDLLELLDKPNIIMGIDNKMVSLDFDGLELERQ